jgi:hypothetical protein
MALLIALALLYLIRNVLHALVYIDSRFSDFGNYHLASRALLAGDSPFSIHNFDYPPLLSLILLPLAPLKYLDARVIWFWFGHICLLIAALLIWRKLGGDRLAALVVAAVWTLAGTVAESLVLGQVNPLLLLLIVLAMVLPPRIGAAAVAVAAALKLWPATLFLADLLQRRWRPLLVGTSLAAALVVMPLAGFKLLLPGPHLPQSSGYWMGTPAVLSFSLPSSVLRLASFPAGEQALPHSWTHGNDPRQLELTPVDAALSLITAAAALALGLAMIRHASRHTELDRVSLLGAVVAITLAASPICWYHYQMLQFPAIAALGTAYLRRRQWLLLAALAGAVLGLTWLQVLVPEKLGLTSITNQAVYYVGRGLVVPIISMMLALLLIRPSARL